MKTRHGYVITNRAVATMQRSCTVLCGDAPFTGEAGSSDTT